MAIKLKPNKGARASSRAAGARKSPRAKKIRFRRLPKKPLPTTLSGWIEAAVEDARRLEKMPGFRLDMFTYNTVDEEKSICRVCLGGAAIVGRGLVKPGGGTNGNFSDRVAHALDRVRVGCLMDAMAWLEYQVAPEHRQAFYRLGSDLETGYYNSTGGRASWRAYLTAARELKRLGY